MANRSEATLAAIKHAVDIVSLIGEYLTLHRFGAKFKALCPFHDDHNPSLEINPERQSFKCWSCGAGGDVFSFVQLIERVEFPEAKRLLAERAGVVVELPSQESDSGVSKADLFAVNAWAQETFAAALKSSEDAWNYVVERGITEESVAAFRLGFAPDDRDWLTVLARKAGFATGILEKAGLVSRSPENPRLTRERFRGRLMFPIRDARGRVLAFGGRILPEFEKKWVEAGKGVAKYLNSPETPIFHKRRVLYGADLARTASRTEGWVAVVEGYTDVIAAHQTGLKNFVGSLGTAFGEDHVSGLRRLAERVVLVFDGDEAGQTAAERSLELFLAHEIDARVLTLPSDLDPCDFLLSRGAEPFREMVNQAADPLAFAMERLRSKFDLDSAEGARQASEWILSILSRVPSRKGGGIDVKVGKALDGLSRRIGVPVPLLSRRLVEIRAAAKRRSDLSKSIAESASSSPVDPAAPVTLTSSSLVQDSRPTPPASPIPAVAPTDLDAIDRELIRILLNEPEMVGRVVTRVSPRSLRDASLRTILHACYELHAEGVVPTFECLSSRLEEQPAVRALAAALLPPIDQVARSPHVQAPPWDLRLDGLLHSIADREWKARLRDLKKALDETDPANAPEDYQALRLEYLRLSHQRPDTKTRNAS